MPGLVRNSFGIPDRACNVVRTSRVGDLDFYAVTAIEVPRAAPSLSEMNLTERLEGEEGHLLSVCKITHCIRDQRWRGGHASNRPLSHHHLF